MADLTPSEIKQIVIDTLDEVGANVSTQNDIEIISSISEWQALASSITLPGVEMEQSQVKRYVAAPMSYFQQYVENDSATIKNAWIVWFGSDDTSGVQKAWKDLRSDSVSATNAARAATDEAYAAISDTEAATRNANTAADNADTSRQQIETNEATRQVNESVRQSNEATRQTNESVRQSDETVRQTSESGRVMAESSRVTEFSGITATASSDHTRAETDHTTAISDHTTANADHTRAGNDHTASVRATDEASNVNAEISGMTVTITDRQGISSSVNIGFDIYRVYPSVAAMNADAGNVPDGKFVMIATTDPTSQENARLYGKNSQGGFTFLSDLDQASTSAWADWLENMKPQIESAISTASSDHTTATSDHTTAQSDHTIAESDHSTASSDHSQAVLDSTQAGTDHTTAASDHTIAENDHTQAVTDTEIASDDHTQAANDHTTASSDHATAQTDHNAADSDHTRAEGDHTTATNDHTQAGTDHTAAVTATQYANEQGDYAKAWVDHPPFIGDGTTGDLNYWYLWNIITEQYVRSAYAKGDNLEWDDITPAEKQLLINEMLQTLETEGFDAVPTENSTKPVRSGGIYTALQAKSDTSHTHTMSDVTDLVFASVQTCEDIIDELNGGGDDPTSPTYDPDTRTATFPEGSNVRVSGRTAIFT